MGRVKAAKVVKEAKPESEFPSIIYVYIDGEGDDKVYCTEPSADPVALVGLVQERQRVATYELTSTGQFENKPSVVEG